MKFIIDKISAVLPFKSRAKEIETEYTDLAPIDQIENGAEYEFYSFSEEFRATTFQLQADQDPYGSSKVAST